MLCLKCKKEIADGSAFCNWCGKKQTVKKKRSRKRANSQGSVYKLSGNRSKPWAAILPCKYDNEGNQKRTILGYYATKTEALNDLNVAVASNTTDRINMTLSDIFNAWKPIAYRELSDKSIKAYDTAYNHLKPLHKMKIKDIRANDVQKIIDSKPEHAEACKKIRVLYSQLCKHAMSMDIISQNYSQFLKIPKSVKDEKKVFTKEQIKQIFSIAESGNETAMIIIIMIYCGMRIGEILDIKHEFVNITEGYMIGGKKTAAGKNRIVPFNDKIIKFIEHFYYKNGEYLIPNESNGKKDASNFRKREFYPFLESIGITGITPHSTRHTFATLGQAAGIAPEDMIKLIGHTDYTTTTEHYIHQNLEKLKNAINKI